MDKCEWKAIGEGEYDGCYYTFCENTFEFNDEGTPSGNGFKYCPYCGKEILEVKGE